MVQDLLLKAEANIAIVETTGPRRDWKQLDRAEQQLTRGQAPPVLLGYQFHIQTAGETDTLALWSEFPPLQVITRFQCALESRLEVRLNEQERFLLVEFDQFLLLAARFPKVEGSTGVGPTTLSRRQCFERMLEMQVRSTGADILARTGSSKPVVFAGQLGVTLHKHGAHDGLARTSPIRDRGLVQSTQSFLSKLQLVDTSVNFLSPRDRCFTFYPSGPDKRRGRGAQTSYALVSSSLLTEGYPGVARVRHLHHLGGGAHVPVELTLNVDPLLVRRQAQEQLQQLCEEFKDTAESACTELNVIDALSEFLADSSAVWAAANDCILQRNLHQLGWSTHADDPKDDAYATVTDQRGSGTAMWRIEADEDAPFYLARLRHRGGSYACCVSPSLVASGLVSLGTGEEALCLLDHHDTLKALWITAGVRLPEPLCFRTLSSD